MWAREDSGLPDGQKLRLVLDPRQASKTGASPHVLSRLVLVLLRACRAGAETPCRDASSNLTARVGTLAAHEAVKTENCGGHAPSFELRFGLGDREEVVR
mmetsp:Transcript_1375/g.1955  ORF Transcript_1375/g.1955 Transcript_1375/m.1955 type:complete len:100 (+) Transcript_1375:274-573(+)